MPKAKFRFRRVAGVVGGLIVVAGIVIANPKSYEFIYRPAEAESSHASKAETPNEDTSDNEIYALNLLEKLEIKGRAPKTGYSREEFYKTWPKIDGCSLRQRIIKRELGDTAKLADDKCTVTAGEFNEPYTGEHMTLENKTDFSKKIQIDHVVALSDAWQKGAQYLDKETRYNIATDPLNLLAVEANANQQKSDGDAATWLPPNKAFRCQYVARQVSVKYKYTLWVTQAEHDAIARILETCPNEKAVGVELKGE